MFEVSRTFVSKYLGFPPSLLLANYAADEIPIAGIAKHEEKVHDHLHAVGEAILIVNEVHEFIANDVPNKEATNG